MRVFFVFLGFLGWIASLQAQPPEKGNLPLALIEQRMRGAYERISPAVVRITYGTRHNRELTGVVVTPDGHVVTAYNSSIVHDDLLAFHLADGRRVRGKALGFSGEFGIALLKITEKGPWPHVDLGNRADVKAGQLCVALGYPRLTNVEPDRWPALRLGTVTKSAAPFWLTSSCSLKVGVHGIFDLKGRLVGWTSSVPPSQRDHVHTSVEMIRTHWDDLVAGKNLDRVRLHSSEADAGESPAAPPSKSQPVEDKDRVATVIEKATAAAVRIREASEERGWSGVIVTADGYVITCGHHGRLPGQRVTISLSDGRDASAVILGTNLVSDVGLIKITDDGPWPHAELGHSAIMKPSDRCILIAYPAERPGRQPWVSEAQIVQRTNTLPAKDEWYPRFWTSVDDSQLTGLGGGSSGGGVFDLQGRVVGVILGGNSLEGKKHHKRHARVELFHKQWDILAASKPVEVLDSDPLAEVMAALRRIADDLPTIAVDVLVDGKPRVLGTIVGSDGRILTKASELGKAVSCRLADGRVFPARVQKVFQEHDLALLKIDAAGLPEARWSTEESIAPGALIAALVPGKPALTGVVSLAARARPVANGGLGVSVQDGDGGLEVHREYGFDVPLRKGDVVVHVEDRATPDSDAYHALFEPKSGAAIAYAGDTVRVGVRRGRDTLEFRFALPPSNFWDYRPRNASRRWWGFPSVFSTDIRLTPKQCGGPVIDKSGRVVGITIACLPPNHIKFRQRHVIPAHLAREVVAD